MSTPRAAYRSLLREFRKSSISPRQTRNTDIPKNFRALFEVKALDKNNFAHSQQRTVRNSADAVTFLRAQREYNELLKRYNPLHDMSQEEHRAATARRVGLNMPKKVEVEDL